MAAQSAETALPPGTRLPSLIQTWIGLKNPFVLLEYSRRRYGKTFTIRGLDQSSLIFFSDPADVKEIFSAPADVLHAGEGTWPLRPIVGDSSFFLLDEDEHLKSRRAAMPGYQHLVTPGQIECVAEIAERQIASWPRDTPFPLHSHFLRSLILEMVLHGIFGSREDEQKISQLRDELLKTLAVFSSVLVTVPTMRRIPPGRGQWSRFLRQRKKSDAMIFGLINERSKQVDKGNDALGLLFAEYENKPTPVSHQKLRDEILSMVLAGHETTASALSWGFQLLAHNPSVLERLTSEIDRGDDNAYLKATVLETLRIRPVFIFAIPRVVQRRVTIAGRSYAPSSQLLGSIYLIHHDPSFFPEPHAFRPERFLENSPDGHVWLPWGGGRKRCPGSHAALMEMETVISTALRNVSIEPVSRTMEGPRWRNVIVTPRNGCRLILRDRVRPL